MIELIIGFVIFFVVIFIITVVYHNRFRFVMIKISEADNHIDAFLEKKMELLEKSRPIIVKELKKDDFLEELEELHGKELNHFELNDLLKNSFHSLCKLIEDNEKLLQSEELVQIMDNLNDNEEQIVGSIKFYNDSVVLFHQLLNSFPSNILAFFCRYKRKEFYPNEKMEMYEILNG